MTKVVVIRPYATLPSEGGSNDRYINVCKALIKAGAQVKLICSDFVHNNKKRRSSVEQDVNLRAFPFLVHVGTLPYSANLSVARVLHECLFGISAVFYLLTNPRADILVVGEPLFGTGWLVVLYGYLFRVPVLADVIDLWPEADTNVHRGVLRKFAYAVLKLSRTLRLHCYRAVSWVSVSYPRQLGFGESEVFYWGSELEPDKPHGALHEKLQVIYAGSFGIGYDILTVLKAAERIHREIPGEFHFAFAGSGPQLSEVKRAHAEGHIEYLGVLDRQSLIRRYEISDIGLLPYKPGSMVAMPIKFFDYLNFGLYTLTDLTLEAGQIVIQHKIGDIYKAGDSGDLFLKLKRIKENQDELNRVRERCGTLAKQFSIGEQYGRFARYVLDHVKRR